MFEQQQQPKQPSPSNTQPQDMFASTDPVAEKPSGVPVKPGPVPSAPRPAVISSQPQSRRKTTIIFLLIVVVVGIAVGALAFYFTKRSNPLPELPSGSEQEVVPPGPSDTIEIPGVEPFPNEPIENEQGVNPGADIPQQPVPPLDIPVPEPVPPTPIDQDRDGLTSEEEAQLMTSDSLIDTDMDGLSDWDEVRVYKSDPLVADTDGDSYLDGHEVQNGYSPVGPGRLNEIPQQ